MKKKKSDILLQKLIENKISRLEFEELLGGLEDTEMAIYLEASMKAYFDRVMEEYQKGSDIEESIEDEMENRD
jgi:hypothetical protein